ncbi:C25 family cysteine peptidase [Bacteroidales bacterium OttesenSCG-928-I21]|nr:C25 family cysteine peptidase [Bacteroidales bacterium OttesenSCG-928-I21]
MHRILIIFFFAIIITVNESSAQSTSNNEWINYDQQYFKISISNDGIYRMTYSELLAAGIPVNTIDPRGIQLFYEGEEQYIYIYGENNSGIFDPNGFIEFYGKRNRGKLDTDFYDNATNQVNSDYSLYNDTSAYFLTWSYSTSSRRMTQQNSSDFDEHIAYKQQFCYNEVRTNYTSNYFMGSTQNFFTSGEGWFDGSIITISNTVRKNIPTPNAYISDGIVDIEFAVVGAPAASYSSNVEHKIKIDFLGETRLERTYSGYGFVKETMNVPASLLSNTIQFIFSRPGEDGSGENDRNTVSYINVKYPYSWNFQALDYKEFYLPKNIAASKDYIEITGFNSETSLVLYDLTSHDRILVQNISGNLKALVNNTEVERFMILTNQYGYKTVDRITKISSNNKFTNYAELNNQANYIIITHKNLLSAANQYAEYRTTTGYRTMVVDIQQLYDQFAYGVDKHPSAIRRFANKLFDNNDRLDRTFFLLGKSYHNITFRKSTSNFANCLVPSGGYPSSDNILTAGLGPTRLEPLYATGRLSVTNAETVLNYLEKVKEYEANQPAEWMKNILHFGGGATANEQTTFKNYLLGYQNIIEDTLFGGTTKTFLKTSSSPIQIAQSDSIENLLNTGVSMMTFFGHGSSSGFDQSIDSPEAYNNKGKYPFILANSCYSGDVHGSNSISEQWVNIGEKGAIAFLASVNQGHHTYLNVFSSELYKNISYKNYNTPISKQIIYAIKNTQQSYSNSILMQNTYNEFTLNGDPAIVINSHEKPDILVETSSVSFVPNAITTIMDSFDVKIIVKNIGRATATDFSVSINRTFPDGGLDENSIVVAGCRYSDTLSVKLPVDRLKGAGINKIFVFVDANNDIDEINENNNQAQIDFFISTSDMSPIYPYNYAIYPNKRVSLIASSSEAFINYREYKFQIDTTDSFDSPLLNQSIVISEGGLVSWEPPFDLVENRVYYWRIAINTPNSEELVWNESSFIYEHGQEGWSQAHYYQFKENNFSFINYDRSLQKFTFVDVPKRLNVHNRGSVWSGVYNEIGWNIDGSTNNGLGDTGNCAQYPSMNIVVIDPITLLAWGSDVQDYGHRNYPQCFSANRPQYYFTFSTGNTPNYTQSMLNIANLINDVPDGYYIVAYSWVNGFFQNWSEEIYEAFESLGSTLIRTIPNGHPYIFYAKKGIPTTAQEIFGTSPTDNISLPPTYLSTEFPYGDIMSVEVGPATDWISMHWMQETIDENSSDEVKVNVYGITPQGNETIVIEALDPSQYDIYSLSDSIDYNNYPKLRLEFYTRDDENKTPAQLKKWQVKFKGVPETAIDPSLGLYFCCDTIDKGDEIKFAVATKNITNTSDMDSLVVKYWIQDKNNRTTVIDQRTLRPHPAGDVIIDTVNYSTINLSGINSIWIEYNPMNEETGTYYQPEQYHFNNISVKHFYVQGDITNPLLDVSFDGKYIMNGEIVSARPEILIKLKDENKFLALNDTSLFRIYLTNLNTNVERRIYFANNGGSNEIIEWIPASLPENSCKVIYRPVFIENGTYRLRVQAKDVSENMSGINDYVIDFEIVTESSISHLLNYPNPFSTSTRFVFELTGWQVPDDLRIEIYTASGKLVKVIYLDELGPIKIGKNITEYAWDGKDMYGDKLANGVYFYKVKARLNGENINHRNTDTDKFFKHEIGKMYIMR